MCTSYDVCYQGGYQKQPCCYHQGLGCIIPRKWEPFNGIKVMKCQGDTDPETLIINRKILYEFMKQLLSPKTTKMNENIYLLRLITYNHEYDHNLAIRNGHGLSYGCSGNPRICHGQYTSAQALQHSLKLSIF